MGLLSRKKRTKPSLNEIDAVLRQELAPQFAALEKLRKNVHTRMGWASLIIGGTALLLLGTGLLPKAGAEIVGGLVGMFSLFALWFVRSPLQEFKSHYKELIIRPVANRFFPELTYLPGNHISRSLYEESQLFRTSLDTYTGNDFFSGRLGEVDFRFSELLCQYTTGSGKRRTTHTAFRGFFFVGDFHRDIYFRTTIRPDTAEKWLGVMGRGLQRMGSGNRLVDLEDPEFEKMFVVTGDDQVEARYILTPVFMEKLKDFRKRIGKDTHLAFVNGKMFLAIESSRDHFEPRMFGELLERKDVMEFIDTLTFLIEIAEEFLHHRKFGPTPPAMPHPPLPPKAIKENLVQLAPELMPWRKA